MPAPIAEGVDILDPTIHVPAGLNLAARLASLDGKTLGLLDNSKEKAEVFLAAIADRLVAQFQVAQVIQRRKPTYSRVAPPSMIAELSACDAVITAMGA